MWSHRWRTLLTKDIVRPQVLIEGWGRAASESNPCIEAKVSHPVTLIGADYRQGASRKRRVGYPHIPPLPAKDLRVV